MNYYVRDANSGLPVLISDTDPMPSAVMTIPADTWTTLIDVTLDDDPTAYNSPAYSVVNASAAWVLISIDSTNAPTNVRILAQVSHDGGTTWWDFEEGLWASLYWEDTVTAGGINKAYLLPISGVDTIRFRAVGTGTDASNTFAVTVMVRAFHGNFGMAHA